MATLNDESTSEPSGLEKLKPPLQILTRKALAELDGDRRQRLEALMAERDGTARTHGSR